MRQAAEDQAASHILILLSGGRKAEREPWRRHVHRSMPPNRYSFFWPFAKAKKTAKKGTERLMGDMRKKETEGEEGGTD